VLRVQGVVVDSREEEEEEEEDEEEENFVVVCMDAWSNKCIIFLDETQNALFSLSLYTHTHIPNTRFLSILSFL
jgi:hypothetical protein